jgi:hypothetical protein
MTSTGPWTAGTRKVGGFLSQGRLLLLAGLLFLAAGASACGGGGSSDSTETPTLNVAVASYDMAAGKDTRFIAGLLTLDNDFVSFGTAQMRFTYLGTGQTTDKPVFYKEETASFLQIPGEGPATPPDAPKTGAASDGRGVYAVDPINFDRAGYWQVDITVETSDRGKLKGSSAFGVNPQTAIPAPGDKALASDSLTVDSDVPAAAIDSRATTTGDIPDPALHQLSIADALKQDKPLVIVFSTPVFCVSQFCGPVTEMISGLQEKYGGDANFIHIEIWKDFQAQTINDTAKEWLFRNGNLNEPWVFLVGRDGTILARWDNVATEGEIVPALEAAIAAQ